MTLTTMTSREFSQDASGAKKAARQGPVFITDRGRPAHTNPAASFFPSAISILGIELGTLLIARKDAAQPRSFAAGSTIRF